MTMQSLRIAAVLVLAVPAVSLAQDMSVPPEEALFARLGCRNCHGRIGDGGKGKPGGPIIAKPAQPLRRFVGFVRLPISMPPSPPEFAPDADLAAIYHWLEGAESVAVPTPVKIDLHPVSASEIEVAVSAPMGRNPGSWTYRLTFISSGANAAPNLGIEYVKGTAWAPVAPDARGEAMLDAGSGFVSFDSQNKSKVKARLRVSALTTRTVVVVEALEAGEASEPSVLGIGTVTLKGL